MTRSFAANSISGVVAVWLCVPVMLVSCAGCRLCCDSGDKAYGAYGGIWARTHRDNGRVGSVFDPGGAMVANLTPKPAPEDQRPSTPETDGAAPQPPESTEPGQSENGSGGLGEDAALEKRLESIGVTPGEPLPPDFQ